MATVHRSFPWRALATISALLLLALLAWRLVNLLLLIFAAGVVATVLDVLAGPIVRRTPLSRSLSLAAALLVILSVLAVVGYFFGRQLQSQIVELSARLPDSWRGVKAAIGQYAGGDQLLSALQGLSPPRGIASRVGSFLTSAADVLVNLVVVLVGGFYLAANPKAYRNGALRLLPQGARDRAGAAIDACVHDLRRWLLGQLVSMTAIALMVGLGLWFIGVPAAFALALLAGLAEFVPLAGPVISAAPALLMALSVDMRAAVWVMVLFVVVQQLESNLLTPLVQRKVVKIPPLVTLFSILGLGMLFGPLGIVLAGPLTVVLFSCTKTLYLDDVLGQAEGGRK